MTTPDSTPAAVPAVDPWAPPSADPPAAPTSSHPPAVAQPPSPWTGSQWSFPPPAHPPSTNPWAVVGLVTGLLGIVPVAVPAAVVGIVQTTRHRQRGRGLAIGGLVASTLWALGAVVLVTWIGASWDPRAGTPADVGAVAVGTCLDSPADGASRWTSASCTGVHDAEVYVVDELDDGAWPGEDEVEGQADTTCHAAFAGYVGRGYLTSAHDYGWFSPREQDWADGERRVVCVVVPYEDDVLRAPVRGSGD